MKKLLMIILSLTAGIAAYGQCGTNAYYGGGTSYVGGGGCATPVYAPACAPSRVRWEISPCGNYRYYVQEVSYWVPGQWVYYNGCRTWNDGYYGWRCTNRTQYPYAHVCNQGCGHSTVVYTGGGGYYGGGYGGYNGGYNGNPGHHGGGYQGQGYYGHQNGGNHGSHGGGAYGGPHGGGNYGNGHGYGNNGYR